MHRKCVHCPGLPLDQKRQQSSKEVHVIQIEILSLVAIST